MNNQITSFPVEIYGHILKQLNVMTGSRRIVNPYDIRHVIKYAHSFTCVSKEIAEKINSADVTTVFLNSLVNKYNLSYVHFAAVWNTTTSRKWLWKYIEEMGYEQVYEAVQDIFEEKNPNVPYPSPLFNNVRVSLANKTLGNLYNYTSWRNNSYEPAAGNKTIKGSICCNISPIHCNARIFPY